MTVQRLKLEETIRNREKNIKKMMKMDEKILIRNIDLFQQQMKMASKSGHHDAYALLNEYEMQAIIALTNKEIPKQKNQKKSQSKEVISRQTKFSPPEPDKINNSADAKSEPGKRDFSIFNLERRQTVEELAKWSYSELFDQEREYSLIYKATQSMYIKNRLDIVCDAIILRRENDAIIWTL